VKVHDEEIEDAIPVVDAVEGRRRRRKSRKNV